MKTENIEQYWEKFTDDSEFLAQGYIIDLTESIATIMEARNISKQELADRLKKSLSYVESILNGEIDMQISLLASISVVLGINIIDIPKWISTKSGKKPEIYKEVLLALDTGSVDIGIWDGEQWIFDGIAIGAPGPMVVTHWMPKPQSPKQKKE